MTVDGLLLSTLEGHCGRRLRRAADGHHRLSSAVAAEPEKAATGETVMSSTHQGCRCPPCPVLGAATVAAVQRTTVGPGHRPGPGGGALTAALGYLLGSYDLILGGDRVRTQMGPGPHPGWTAMADASQAITRVAVLRGCYSHPCSATPAGAARWARLSFWRSPTRRLGPGALPTTVAPWP